MQVKGDVSSMEDGSFQAFLLDAIPYMASQEIAWMDAVEADSAIVGVSLNFVHGRKIYYYSGGFEDRYSKSRPGTALFAQAMQRGIESGYTSFNFLRGDESYKYRWGASDVVDQRIVAFPAARIAGLLAQLADRSSAVAGALRQAAGRVRARLK
jgi:CelD/BcsL family acetyltransferase involved in cellulose biosynthesis